MNKILFAGNDVSNYITDCDEVPVGVSYNRDGTLIATDFQCKIAALCAYTYNVNSAVACYADISGVETLIFYGYIVTKDYDYESRCYKLLIASGIKKMQNEYVRHTLAVTGEVGLHTLIANTSDPINYQPIETDCGLPTVSLLWLLQKLFHNVGTLSTSTIAEAQVIDPKTELPFYAHKLDGWGYIVTTESVNNFPIRYKHIRLDENTLYAIGQTYASAHAPIEDDSTTQYKTYFDLFSCILSAFRLRIKQTAAGVYVLYYDSKTPFTVIDLLNYKTDISTQLKNSVESTQSKIYYNSERLNYNSNVRRDLGESSGLAYGSNYPNNLMFRLAASVATDETHADGALACFYLDLYGHQQYSTRNFPDFPIDSLTWQSKTAEENNWQIKKQETVPLLNDFIKESYYNYSKKTMTITQESII